MLLTLDNQKLSIDQLERGAFDLNNFSPNAKYVIEFIVSWLNGAQSFQFQTSGSTGKPKKIRIAREVLEYSARQTLDRMGWPTAKAAPFLLCINPRFIGGTMVIVRSLMADAALVVVPPSSRIEQEGRFYLASMVPLQVAQLLNDNPQALERFDHILIGGGALDRQIEAELLRLRARLYHTYGMTETASHVALRPLGAPCYEALGDVQFRQGDDGALIIEGTVTSHRPLATSDIVRLQDVRHFEWLGRKDFVINSGGYKVHPEGVEAALAPQLDGQLVISSLPDALLGQKVILITESPEKELDLTALHPYERPKQTFYEQKLHYTATGKIDRQKTHDHLLKALQIDH